MRYIKRFFFIITVALLILLLGLVIVAGVYEDDIGRKVLTEASKQLNADLQVKRVKLSLFTDFPRASVNLTDVLLHTKEQEPILQANRIGLRFGLFSLLSSDIKIHSVIIEKGELNIHIDKKGNANFDIWQTSHTAEQQTDATRTGISLDEAVLRDINLTYFDERTKQKIDGRIEDAVFAGKFSDTRFSLTSNARLFSKLVSIGSIDYLKNRPLAYNAVISVNLEEGTYDFEKVSLSINGNEFIADGLIDVEKDYTAFDLLLTSDKAKLEAVLQLLPAEYLDYFSDFSSEGQFDFELWVQGNLDATSNPNIHSKFSLQRGEIYSDKLPKPLKKVSFEAAFTNGQYKNNKSSVFEIKDFVGYFDNEKVTSQLSVADLNNPKIDFELDGDLQLSTAYQLFNTPIITDGKGKVAIRDVRINGRYKNMLRKQTMPYVTMSGDLAFEEANLTFNNGQEMQIEQGNIQLKGNNIRLEKLLMKGANSEFLLSGSCENLLPVLLADSLNSNHTKLEFSSQLIAEHLDLDQLIALTEVPAKEKMIEKGGKATKISPKAAQVKERERLSDFLRGSFNAKVAHFSYGEIVGDDFVGEIDFKDQKMMIEGSTVAMDGTFDLDGTLLFKEKPELKAKLVCEQVNIKEFFRQSENFGQEVLEDRHLSGKMNANIYVEAFFDEEGRFLSKDLQVYAGVGITDGEIQNFELFEDFSTYVKIKDLENIKLVDLQNWLEISHEKIYIPTMFIQSNALNLTLNGSYTFEHDLDFNLKVNAGQVIVNRFKQHDPKLNPQPASDGLFNLFYKIHGNISDYDYERNKREVKQDLARSEHRKRFIKRKLKEKFGNLQLIDEKNNWSNQSAASMTDASHEEVEYIEWQN